MGRWSNRPIHIEGEIAYVPLTRGQTAVIDAADVPLVGNRDWNAQPNAMGGYYAASHWKSGDPKHLKTKGPLYMHRLIANPQPGQVVDHDNHDTLYNRRSNLVACSNRDNNDNRRGLHPTNKTGHRGVSIHTTKEGYKMYVARVTVAKYFPLTDKGLQRAAAEAMRLRKRVLNLDEA